MDLYWGRVVTPMGRLSLVGSERGIQTLWFDDTAQGEIPYGCPRDDGRAQDAFTSARLHWFEKCGHFPMWDQPRYAL